MSCIGFIYELMHSQYLYLTPWKHHLDVVGQIQTIESCHLPVSTCCESSTFEFRLHTYQIISDWFAVQRVYSRISYWTLKNTICQFLCIWQNTIYVNTLGSIKQVCVEPSINGTYGTVHVMKTQQQYLMINSIKCSGNI